MMLFLERVVYDERGEFVELENEINKHQDELKRLKQELLEQLRFLGKIFSCVRVIIWLRLLL